MMSGVGTLGAVRTVARLRTLGTLGRFHTMVRLGTLNRVNTVQTRYTKTATYGGHSGYAR